MDDMDDGIDPDEHFERFKAQALQKLLASDYKAVNIDDVIAPQHHLSDSQIQLLGNVLNQHVDLFNGNLDHYPNYLTHVDLYDNVKATHAKPYPIPYIHIKAFKKELQHLLEIGVLRCCGPTEWACPAFVTPKKDGCI